MFEQVEVACNGVCRAELQRGNLVAILPIAHPSHQYMVTLRCVIEGYGGVMVLAVVHPFGCFGLVFAGKLVSIKLSDEVLCGVSTKGSARIDVANQHPLLFIGAANGQLHQVGTFPNAIVIAVSFAKTALERPLFEVLRRVELHFLSSGKHHYPAFGGLMPKHVRVAKVGYRGRYYGVAIIFRESLSVVCAVRHALRLVLASRGIEGHHRTSAKASRVVMVYNGTAAEYRSQSVGSYGSASVFPVHKVFANAVTPSHVLPLRPIGVPLVVKVVQSVFVEEAVGVVHPPVGRCVMVQRAPLFAVGRVEVVGH